MDKQKENSDDIKNGVNTQAARTEQCFATFKKLWIKREKICWAAHLYPGGTGLAAHLGEEQDELAGSIACHGG